jgi:2-polyprenyl-3-methyl-5-hydroxy-6-metoxy-1,4-benzoquinol methylase
MKKNKILKQQSEYYSSYEKVAGNPRYRKAWDFIFKSVKGKKKILDIGCADGEFLTPFLKKDFGCYGLEAIETAIKDSRRKGIKVVRGSFLEKFPFNDSTFDIIFAGEVIEHTFDDDYFLNEVHRVLKRKGLLVLTTPNLVSLGNRLLMLIGKLPRFAYAPFHYRIYTPQLLKSKLQDSSFKIIKFESSYIGISTYYNKPLGYVGEKLGTLFPFFGEHLILFAIKK